MARFLRPYVECRPAYGRDYLSWEKCSADWESGKDFQDILTGQYFSIRDLEFMQLSMGTNSIGFHFKLGHGLQNIINL